MQTRIQEDLEVRNSGGYFDSVRRNAGWIAGSVFAALVLSVTGAYLWPDTYLSTVTLRMTDSVPPVGVLGMNDRVLRLTSTVESRMAMESVIQVYGLFPNERKRLPVEDLVANMKRQIHVGDATLQSGGKQQSVVFPISFEYGDRFKAQKVLQDLAARFMSEANPSRADTVFEGPQYFKDQLESARKDVEAAESKLDQFRTANEGHLPDQAETNLRKMIELETRRTTVQTSLLRMRSEQTALETSLASDQEKRRNIKEYIDIPAPPKVENKQVAAYNKQMQEIEQQIKTLKEQYTENFPDVKDARQRLTAIKSQRDALVKEDTANAQGPTRRADPEAARAAADLDVNIKSLQSQIASKANDIVELSKEGVEVDQDIQAMKTRLEKKPDVEKQYTGLLQERDMKKARVDEVEIKYNAAREGGQHEERKPGEILVQLDSPSLPTAPISPNRAMIIGAGSLIGLLIGFVLAGTRGESRSLIAAEPSPRGWSGWTVAIAIGIAAMVSSVGYYYARSS